MRNILMAFGLFALLAPLGASAQATKDAKLGTYVRYADANIRIDKIESVRHVDGNALVKDLDAGENGYLIVSLSVQNPGSAEIFMPNLGTTLFLDDQSKVQSDIRGPYVGAATADAPGRIAPKESIRIRYVVPDWPGKRVTKLVLDPNNGSPMLRFQINATDVVPLAEIPRPKPTD